MTASCGLVDRVCAGWPSLRPAEIIEAATLRACSAMLSSRCGFVGRMEAEGAGLPAGQRCLHGQHRLRNNRPDPRLVDGDAFEDPSLGPPAHAPQGFLRDRLQCLARIGRQIRSAEILVTWTDGSVRMNIGGFFDAEGPAQLVLQAQLPGPGTGGMISPEALVGDAETGVLAALRIDSRRPVASR